MFLEGLRQVVCRDWMAGREGPSVPRQEVMEAMPGQLQWREEREVRDHGGARHDSPVQAGGCLCERD